MAIYHFKSKNGNIIVNTSRLQFKCTDKRPETFWNPSCLSIHPTIHPAISSKKKSHELINSYTATSISRMLTLESSENLPLKTLKVEW